MSIRNSMKRLSIRKRGSTTDSSLSDSREMSSSSVDDEEFTAFLDGPATKKKCVVAIDFGTSNSGFAYSLTKKKKINVVRRKEKTCVLFRRKDKKLIEFGEKAVQIYRKNQAGQELLRNFPDMSGNTPRGYNDDFIFLDENIKMKMFEKSQEDREKPQARWSGISYFDVVSGILERMKDMCFERISADDKEDLVPEEVLWVVTVPSIWKESDKQFMRRAAERAGLVRDEFSADVCIALESECAAVWAERFFARPGDKDTKKGKRGKARTDSESWPELVGGEKVLCLDCGGGTVDISAIHIQKDEKGQTIMQQLLEPTGLKVGARTIDRQFHKFMVRLLGPDNFRLAWEKCPEARIELSDGWERIKTSLTHKHFLLKKGAKPKVLDLDTTLAELHDLKLGDLVEKFNAKEAERVRKLSKPNPNKPQIKLECRYKIATLKNTKLVIPPALLLYCFKDTIEKIVGKITDVLEQEMPDGVDHMVLYGGLGNCDYLQEEVKKRFISDKTSVLTSTTKQAELAVIKGAVKYGMFPKVISSRRARMTVGVKVTVPFVRGVHNKSPHIAHKQYDADRREYFIRDAFKTFCVRGSLVDVREQVTQSFSPAGPNRENIKFELYASSNKHVDYVTEEGCLKLAKIVVPIEKGAMRPVTVSLSFGYTEIRAVIVDDKDNVVREVPLQFDKVGENAIISAPFAEKEDLDGLNEEEVEPNF